MKKRHIEMIAFILDYINFTFRQMTCLNFHLPRWLHSTMPPHRLVALQAEDGYTGVNLTDIDKIKE